MSKSGLTMASMVLYVTLFFAFSTFAIALSSNMNYSTLSEKGNIWVNEQYDKLQYNLIKSAKSSDAVYNISGRLVFSNNDEYTFDTLNKKILKNGGVIATDVESFDIITNYSTLADASSTFSSNLDNNKGKVAINISFLKYGISKNSQIFVTVGDEKSE